MNREQRRALSKAKPQPVKRKTMPITWRHTETDETGLQLDPLIYASTLLTKPDDVAWTFVVFRLNWGRAMNGDHFNEDCKAVGDALDVMHDITEQGMLTIEQHSVVAAGLAACNDMQKLCTSRELRQSFRRALSENRIILSQ